MRTFTQAEWLRIQQERVHDTESCVALATKWPEAEQAANNFARRKNKVVNACRPRMKMYLFKSCYEHDCFVTTKRLVQLKQ